MKKLLLVFTILLAFACSNNLTNKEALESLKFGNENITEEGAISGDELMFILETEDSAQVKVIAVISEVCQKKGCWMEVDLDDTNQMLVRFLDYGFFIPLDAAGKTAIIEGIAKVDTLSVSWLKHQLEDAEASQEEIDAVTEPEISYTIEEATGVILK